MSNYEKGIILSHWRIADSDPRHLQESFEIAMDDAYKIDGRSLTADRVAAHRARELARPLTILGLDMMRSLDGLEGDHHDS